MNAISKCKATLVCFIGYALSGALVTVTGMIIAPVATSFNISVAEAMESFTFLNAGFLVSVVISGWLLSLLSLQTLLLLTSLVMVVVSIFLSMASNVIFFSSLVFFLGVVGGILTSISAFLISYMYHGSERSTKMLLTESCFSIAGILIPIICNYMFKLDISWQYVFILLAGLSLMAFELGRQSHLPSLPEIRKRNVVTKNEPWNGIVYCCAIAALLYIIAQLSFVYWIPRYIHSVLHFSMTDAAEVLSIFWFTNMIGLLSSSFIVRYIPQHRFIVVTSALATLSLTAFLNVSSIELLMMTTALVGLFSAGIYPTIITIASMQVSLPTPKLIGFILTFGTCGTLLTPLISGEAVQADGVISALIAGNVFFLLTFLVLVVIAVLSKKQVKVNMAALKG